MFGTNAVRDNTILITNIAYFYKNATKNNKFIKRFKLNFYEHFNIFIVNVNTYL